MDVDDVPVGAGGSKSGANAFGSEFPDEGPGQSASSNKTLDQKIISKKWNERASAYEELSELLKISKSKDSIFNDHSEGFKNYLSDSNPGALEKAVDCYIEFVKKAPNSMISEMKATAINLLISKSICHMKQSLQDKGLEAICWIIENTEDFEGVSIAVWESIASSNVKVAGAAVTTITHLVKWFGLNKFPLKKLLGPVEQAVGSKQVTVRQSALGFYEEWYKWIGEAIMPAVEKLNKPQQDELGKLFATAKEKGLAKPKPLRVTKADEENQKQAQIDEILAKEEEEEKKDAEFLDLAEEKDVLSVWTEAWAEEIIGMKKWSDKKDKIDQFNAQANTPKILPNRNVINFIKMFEKMVKDSNMNVYDETVKAVGFLAKGLKREFREYAKVVIGPILSNIKKSAKIIQDVTETLESILLCVDLEDVINPVLAGLKDKSPIIVKQSCEFMQKTVKQTYIDDLKKQFEPLCSELTKLANHQDSELRDMGLATLGIFKARIGDAVDKFISSLNQQKLDKITEAAAQVQLTKYDKSKVAVKKALKKEDSKAEVAFDEDDSMGGKKPLPKKKAKGPPARLAKQQEGKDTNSDLGGAALPPKAIKIEKKDPTPASKPAAAAKPAPAALAKTVKPAGKKPKIAVEESGPGVAKEDAEAIVTDRVPAEILKLFEESKWQDKVEAYSRYAKWLIEQEYSNEIYEASFWYIKIRQKEWKENNVNLVKAALGCLSDVIKESEWMSKKASIIIIPFLADNVGDAKYNVMCKENLLSLSELVGPGFAVKYIVKQASSAISPNVLTENNIVIKTIIDEFGVDGLPIQEIINFGIICCDNKNAKVRTETISMLSTLYKHLGEGIRTFLKDIKDSTLSLINSEFSKITPLAKGEFQSKREIRNEEVKQEVEEAAGADPLDCIPRTDVSKDMANQKMVALINDNNWKKRQEAAEKMDAILNSANMRILPNGLSEVVGLLKIKMADSNKSVAKSFLQFVGKFGEALGAAAKQYAPMLIKPMLRCLSEKNTLVRQINLETINKWSEAIGPEIIINNIGAVIEKENPEIRSVLLDWILKNKEAIPRCESDGLPKPLIECLQDKAPAIRQMAEQVIIEVMPFSGPAPFKKLMKDLKPAVQNSIKPLIEKWVAGAGSNNDQEMTPEESKSIPDSSNKTILKNPRGSISTKSLNASLNRPKTAQVMTAKQIYDRLNKNKEPTGKAKAQEDGNFLVILDAGSKEKRNEADKKKRWHPEEMRDDYITKFKNSVKLVFGDAVAIQMFTTDFKTLIKCIKLFKTAFEDEVLWSQFLEVVDIVIKWAYIKSNEISNTTFLKELYVYFDELVDKLIECQYEFMEAEGTVFWLSLVEKVGMNNPTLKEKVKEILLKVGNWPILFHPKKIISILIKGTDSKNSKTIAEWLECIAVIVQAHQLEVINEKDVILISKIVDNPDNGVRQGALAACEEIYKITGEHFWNLVENKLSSKAEDIIKARFKAKLGVPLNLTPVEDKKENSIIQSKSPIAKREDSTPNGSLQASIPLSDASSKMRGRNQERNTQVQSVANFSKAIMGDPQPSQRKESSVNRKLERISSTSRKQSALEVQLDKEISKMDEDDEISPEISKQDADNYMEDDENLDSIGKNIKQLKNGDLSGKVDALVIINEVMTKRYKECQDSILRNSGFLIDSISKVLHDVFNKTWDKVPLKFGKYFISIVNKVCSIKEIMRAVEEEKILILVEQLLLKLLIPGLDSLGDKNEGQAMFRNLNNTILRVLENWNPTTVFVVFLTLLKKYKGYEKIEKLSGILVKCLLKMTRLIEQLINTLNIERILLATHEYLLSKPVSAAVVKSDEVGIRITKTIVNELVKIKKDQIWDYYAAINAHSTPDVYIKKWIEIILMSLGDDKPSPSNRSQPDSSPSNEYTGGLSASDHRRLKIMLEEAQCGNQFREDEACKSIMEFSDDTPNLDLDSYLQRNCTSEGYNQILSGILKAKKKKQIGGRSMKNVTSASFKSNLASGLKTPNKFGGLNATAGKSSRLSTVEKMQEYEEKRANLKQKYGVQSNPLNKSSIEPSDVSSDLNSSSKLKPEPQNNLGHSIAAMNSSITEKWRKINTKGQGNLNNTFGGGFKGSSMQDKSTLDKESNENDDDPEKSTKTKLALQARLNEVKARLGNIKKNHNPR